MSKRARIDAEAERRISKEPETVIDLKIPTRRRPLGRKTFSLPVDTIEQINQLAAARDVSASDIVKFALAEYFKANMKK